MKCGRILRLLILNLIVWIEEQYLLINEKNIYEQIKTLLTEYQPDIVIITGHDAYYRKKGSEDDLNNYKNSLNFFKLHLIIKFFCIFANHLKFDYEKLRIC